MIIEVTPELVLRTIATGNAIHAVCQDGIDPDNYELVDVRMNLAGNVELHLKHRNDETVSPDRFAPMFGTINCIGSR